MCTILDESGAYCLTEKHCKMFSGTVLMNQLISFSV